MVRKEKKLIFILIYTSNKISVMKKTLIALLVSISSTCFAQKMNGDTLIVEISPKVKFVKVGNDVYPVKNAVGSDESNVANIEGEWGDCDGWSPFTITKSGSVIIVHIDNNDYTLEKKSNSLYSGAGGVITLVYDNRKEVKAAEIAKKYPNLNIKVDLTKKKWYLSGIRERTITLCRRSEVS